MIAMPSTTSTGAWFPGKAGGGTANLATGPMKPIRPSVTSPAGSSVGIQPSTLFSTVQRRSRAVAGSLSSQPSRRQYRTGAPYVPGSGSSWPAVGMPVRLATTRLVSQASRRMASSRYGSRTRVTVIPASSTASATTPRPGMSGPVATTAWTTWPYGPGLAAKAASPCGRSSTRVISAPAMASGAIRATSSAAPASSSTYSASSRTVAAIPAPSQDRRRPCGAGPRQGVVPLLITSLLRPG